MGRKTLRTKKSIMSPLKSLSKHLLIRSACLQRIWTIAMRKGVIIVLVELEMQS